MDLAIVPAAASDAAALARMFVALYQDDPGPVAMTPERAARQAEQLAGGGAAADAYLLQQDGHTVGYAILAPFWSNEFGGSVLVVDELFVVAEARGRGVAGAFFAQLDGWARARGFRALFLEVNAGNPRAQRLYERAGFRVLDRRTMIRPL